MHFTGAHLCDRLNCWCSDSTRPTKCVVCRLLRRNQWSMSMACYSNLLCTIPAGFATSLDIHPFARVFVVVNKCIFFFACIEASTNMLNGNEASNALR